MYWNLFHNILKNCNSRYRNKQFYQLYMFTFKKINLKMTPVEQAETCSRKNIIVNKLPNSKLC